VDNDIQWIDIKKEKQSITNLKKMITQLEILIKSNQNILSIKDKKNLESSLNIFQNLIDYKKKLVSKKQNYDKKIEKLKTNILNTLCSYDKKQQLAFILAANINTFDIFIKTLEDAKDYFAERGAQKLLQHNISVEEYFSKIEYFLNNLGENEHRFQMEYENRISVLGL